MALYGSDVAVDRVNIFLYQPFFLLIGIDISRKMDIHKYMDKIEIFKALSNETRLSIIEWVNYPRLKS